MTGLHTGMTVSQLTLGCKVNQYDSQAVLEQFTARGHRVVPFGEPADIVLVNTCVVTLTGEQKSKKTIARARRENPEALVVVMGCLAQRDAEKLLPLGVRLVVGNQFRTDIYRLLDEAVRDDVCTAAVSDVQKIGYERLFVTASEGKTRAVMKIQEGCDRYCAYCIIPSVRGTIRSRPLEDIVSEATRLAQNGYREIALSGIHLSSYGRDLAGDKLSDVLVALNAIPGLDRIRLGSLEPVIVTKEFVDSIKPLSKLCPQFHLSMQSGADAVLKAMRRRYTTAQFLTSARLLQDAIPDCALTTDVIAGFPGETDDDHAATLAFVETVGFAKIHVFPFSQRPGTLAAGMPGQLPVTVKKERARQLIALGQRLNRAYRQRLLGSCRSVLFETATGDGAVGYCPEYMPVTAPGAVPGQLAAVRLTDLTDEGFCGVLVP